jgi:hypothetical protein
MVAVAPPRPIAPLHDAGEEGGGQRHELLELRGGDLQVLGAHDAVDEADGEVQSVGVAQHAGEALAGGIDRNLTAVDQPLLDEGDGVVGQFGEVVDGCFGSGHRGAHAPRMPRSNLYEKR